MEGSNAGPNTGMYLETSESGAEKTDVFQKENSASCTTRTSLKVNSSRAKFEQQDLLVPWHHRGQKTKNEVEHGEFATDSEQSNVSSTEQSSPGKVRVFQRFYHVLKECELVNDCMKLENISVLRSYYDRGNWCVELEKTKK